MFIPGPKLTTVFASRWKALFWAGGILVSVYFFVPREGERKGGDAEAAASAVEAANAGSPGNASSAPYNPWAK